jgi:predicted secreted protein
MTKRNQHDAQLDEYLKGDSPLTRAYRRAASEEPPRKLDTLIMDEARKAVKGRGGFNPFGTRWTMPLAAAAVLVMSVGLVLFMSQQGVGPEAPVMPAPSELPAASAERSAGASQPEVTRRKEMPATAAEQESTRRLSASDSAPASVREKAVLGRAAVPAKPALADVIAVEASGSPGAYQFNVFVMSPDTGCGQYADWWEVVSEHGKLLHRRVLAHSHVDEQPFARSGGPVPIQPDTVVWIRAHMHSGGYGGQAMKGSVKSGFRSEDLPADFAGALAKTPPLPDGCAF